MITEHAMNMPAAEQALAPIPLPPAADRVPRGVKPIQWEEFDGSPATTCAARPKVFCGETIGLRIVLGRAHIDRDEALKLRSGEVVPLDNASHDPVAVYAGRQLIARGELLAIDGRFGVRVLEVLSSVGEN